MALARGRIRAFFGLAGAVLVGVASSAHAETVTANLQSLTPFFEGAQLSLGGSTINTDALGELNWAGNSSDLAPFNSTFSTFCLDLVDNVGVGGNYTFIVDPALSTAPRPAAGGPMGSDAALEMQSLYANHFGTLSSDADRVAFQLSIWSIVYNVFGENMVNNSGLNFFVVGGVNSSVINEANGWLAAAYNAATTLTGPFDSNVVALLGTQVPGTDSFAQDQVFVGDVPGGGVPNFGVPEISSSGLGSLAALLVGMMAIRESKRGVRRGV